PGSRFECITSVNVCPPLANGPSRASTSSSDAGAGGAPAVTAPIEGDGVAGVRAGGALTLAFCSHETAAMHSSTASAPGKRMRDNTTMTSDAAPSTPLAADAARPVVRHLAATLAYRAAKVLRDVPAGFGSTNVG